MEPWVVVVIVIASIAYLVIGYFSFVHFTGPSWDRFDHYLDAQYGLTQTRWSSPEPTTPAELGVAFIALLIVSAMWPLLVAICVIGWVFYGFAWLIGKVFQIVTRQHAE